MREDRDDMRRRGDVVILTLREAQALLQVAPVDACLAADSDLGRALRVTTNQVHWLERKHNGSPA